MGIRLGLRNVEVCCSCGKHCCFQCGDKHCRSCREEWGGCCGSCGAHVVQAEDAQGNTEEVQGQSKRISSACGGKVAWDDQQEQKDPAENGKDKWVSDADEVHLFK